MANARRTHYEVLEIPRTASQQEIRRAYRRLARRYHPDLNADWDSRGRFEELATAYGVLHDPRARARYDRSCAPAEHRRPAFSAVFRVQVVVRMPFGLRWPPW